MDPTLASRAVRVLTSAPRRRSELRCAGALQPMGGLLFVSQAILDTWASQGKIDFAGNVMTILAGDGQGRTYRLDSAVRFLQVIGADADPNGLLHKVKQEVQLKEQGAEVMGDSVILGDIAYMVEPGFLAEADALQAAAAAKADPARAALRPSPPQPAAGKSAAGAEAAAEKRRQEAEALARFLLENLS